MKLDGKVALVTGAGGGIGKSIVSLFINEGANVFAVDISEDGLKGLSSLLQTKSLYTLRADITDAAQVKSIFEQIEGNFGRLDILVNNAGITRDKLIIRMSEEDWDVVLNVNLRAAFILAREAAKMMIRSKGGKIINISSVIAFMGGVGQANYASSKSGLLGLTRALAKELATRNIQVNAILPGYISTPMTDALKEDIKKEYLAKIPLGRFGTPEDVAKAALFLASRDSDYITGNFLFVDGGLSF
jgi:3-oxoacyl-[acyl-carrier protein] reductase